MPDLGRDLNFGHFLVPNADDQLLQTAHDVERLGLDLVGVQDHPYQRRYVDAFTLLAMIAATTSRITVFPDVANLPLRPPAVLAKTAASIDVLSGGRFELGLGAGAFWDAIEAYGGPRRSPGESLDALEEAITIVRMLWSSERGLRFEGKHYEIAGAQSGPPPAHDIGIWLGAYGPRALNLTGRLADGWIPSFRGEMQPISDMTTRLDAAISAAGRELRDVRRILNINGTITTGSSEGPLNGPVTQWADELTDLVVTHGFDTFILWTEGNDQLPRFAEDVIPRVRELVATERVGTSTG